jgi:hypothetical protein
MRYEPAQGDEHQGDIIADYPHDWGQQFTGAAQLN